MATVEEIERKMLDDLLFAFFLNGVWCAMIEQSATHLCLRCLVSLPLVKDVQGGQSVLGKAQLRVWLYFARGLIFFFVL